MIVPFCACIFLVWTDLGRLQRVEYVSGLTEPVVLPDARSPTGYANGQRKLIVPERNENSFHWMAETQQMFAQGEARVRYVKYENAPFGREVNAVSPYRWWLGSIAWLDHQVSGRPLGMSVERAALLADPLLHLLLVIGATILTARQFGGLAAALLAVGLVSIFPLAAGFLPGVPDDRGLANICSFGSVLVLLAGLQARRAKVAHETDGVANRSARGWFVFAGVFGGLGLWVDASIQVPVIAGVFLGALIAAWIARRNAPRIPPGASAAALWRLWALSGGATVGVAYLAEYFPAHLGSWRLESVHPLYGLAWIGAGELLARAATGNAPGKPGWNFRDAILLVLASAAVAAVPVFLWGTGTHVFSARDLASVRLTNLPDGAVAASFRAWVARDGISAACWATVLPLLAVLPAVWLLLRRTTELESRVSLAIVLGPILVALGFASQQLSWWNQLDGALLVLVVVAASRPVLSRSAGWLWSGVVVVFAVAGLTRVLPPAAVGPGMTLTSLESQELIERNLAHWLAKHTGEAGVVVYAPPHQTTTFCYYGGLHGIGTLAAENRAGFGATLMIAGVKTREEVQGLLQSRGVRYIVIPSWDRFFDEFAPLYLARNFSNRTSFLIQELRRWNLPLWLRAVPYQMPVSGGFEGQSVLVFEVVDEQSPVVATSRLAEYLIEIGEPDQAASTGEALRRFPGDIGALAARAQVQGARGEAAALAQTMETLVARLASGADRFLPWDRRVSLAVVLARAERVELARAQTRRCLAELNEQKLRSLSPGSLYGLLVLSQSFGLTMTDPKLHELALDLLPGDLRDRL
jgi:hypothetical protein